MNFDRRPLLTPILFFFFHCYSQDSLSSIQPVSNRYLESIAGRADKLNEKLNRKSQKALIQYQRQEARIKKKLSKIDSSKAALVFNSATEKYKSLDKKLDKGIVSKNYNASLDTILTSLKFLRKLI
jgi:hypothetical protein